MGSLPGGSAVTAADEEDEGGAVHSLSCRSNLTEMMEWSSPKSDRPAASINLHGTHLTNSIWAKPKQQQAIPKSKSRWAAMHPARSVRQRAPSTIQVDAVQNRAAASELRLQSARASNGYLITKSSSPKWRPPNPFRPNSDSSKQWLARSIQPSKPTHAPPHEATVWCLSHEHSINDLHRRWQQAIVRHLE
ncbi:hypothetical protein ACLOJK_027016 [Asimina triloba]